MNSLSFFYYYYFWRAFIKDQRSGWSYNCSSGCRFVLHVSSLDAHRQHWLKTRVSIILVALCSACVCYSIDAHPLYPTPPPWALLHDLPNSIFTLTAVLALWGSVTAGKDKKWVYFPPKHFSNKRQLKNQRGARKECQAEAYGAHCYPADEQVLIGSCKNQHQIEARW